MQAPQVEDEQLQKKINEAYGILSMCVLHNPVVALFSGGKDSVVAAHIAAHHPNFKGILHVQTNTDPLANEASKHTLAIAEAQGWHIFKTSARDAYLRQVLKYGFPGPPSHTYMYIELKEKPIQKMYSKLDGSKKNRVVFATGIRRAESQRRSAAPEYAQVARRRWVSPIINFTLADVYAYIEAFGLEYNSLQDCGCGSFAKPGERDTRMQHEGFKAWLVGVERLVSAMRGYQETEVQLGMRKPKDVIKADHIIWGHGVGTSADTPKTELSERPDGYMVCNDCDGQLDAEGNVGEDMDAIAEQKQVIERLSA